MSKFDLQYTVGAEGQNHTGSAVPQTGGSYNQDYGNPQGMYQNDIDSDSEEPSEDEFDPDEDDVVEEESAASDDDAFSDEDHKKKSVAKPFKRLKPKKESKPKEETFSGFFHENDYVRRSDRRKRGQDSSEEKVVVAPPVDSFVEDDEIGSEFEDDEPKPKKKKPIKRKPKPKKQDSEDDIEVSEEDAEFAEVEESENSSSSDSEEGEDDFQFSDEGETKKRAPPKKPAPQKTYDDSSSSENDYGLTSDEEGNEEGGGSSRKKKEVITGDIPFQFDIPLNIEKVLDHRTVTKAQGSQMETEQVGADKEFFIKWKGKSYVHNTWENYATLMNLPGNKRVVNYIKKTGEREVWRETCSAEEKENDDVFMEMNRDQYREHTIVDRVVTRMVYGEKEYFMIKWKGEMYSSCTWEPKDIKGAQYFEESLIDWKNRLQRFEAWTLDCKPFIAPNKRPLFEHHAIMPSSSVATANNNTGLKAMSDLKWLKGGTLREYQVEGVNWLIHNWCNNIDGILADEMGLGKTIQTVSFLGYLMWELKLSGPFLVIVPLSTIANWEAEFKKWVPDLNVVVYMGDSKSRAVIQQHEFFGEVGNVDDDSLDKKRLKFNVLLTTYEFVIKDKNQISDINWTYLVVDEGHRLKNSESRLVEALREVKIANKLLLTGTPLQNSIKELWCLMNFICPKKFDDAEYFEAAYSNIQDEEQINKLHSQLRSHLLRRTKEDVEKSLPSKTEQILRVEMSSLQKKFYRWIITRNLQMLNRGVKGKHTTLLNIVMELKKVSNHPYLFDNGETESLQGVPVASKNAREVRDLTRINASGKLQVLDKLLSRLRETGHRVLIFSQMVQMLDILGDYLVSRGIQFQRLDGSMSREQRERAMQHFNAPDSKDFCFLLSTRAGGLGINLSTADTVVIFDSDWNPQNDLQAQARAHRIGQKNKVNIYRFVTQGTVEEDILQKAKNKLVLDHLVIQTMGQENSQGPQQTMQFNRDELAEILKFGAKDLFKETEDEKSATQASAIDIDAILARAEVTTGENGQKTAGSKLLSAFKFASFGSSEKKKEAPATPSKSNPQITAATSETDKDPKFWEKLINPDDASKYNLATAKSSKSPSKRDDKKVEYDKHNPLALKDLIFQPRRRTKANAAQVEEEEDEDKSKKKKIKIPVIKTKSKFTSKEVKSFLNAFMKFPSMKRLKDIAKDMGMSSLTSDEEKHLQNLGKELVDACKQAENTGSKEKIDETKVKLSSFKCSFCTVSVPYKEVLRRIEDFEVIEDEVGNQDLQYRLATPLKNPKNWTGISWGTKEDSMLLVGTLKHGWASWSAIQQDQSLLLSKKITSSANDTLLRPEQLKYRLRSLVAFLQSMKAPKKEKELKSKVKPEKMEVDKPKAEKKKKPEKSEKSEKKKESKPKSSSSDKKEDKEKDKKRKETSSSSDKKDEKPAKKSASESKKSEKEEKSTKKEEKSSKKEDKKDEKPKKSSSSDKKEKEEKKPKYDKDILAECSTLLSDMKSTLHKLQKLQDDEKIDPKKKIENTKAYLLEIGKRIDQIVVKESKYPTETLRNHLWKYVSKYTALDGSKIGEIYEKLKK